MECCLHRDTQIQEGLELASPSPPDVQREPPTLSCHLPTCLLRPFLPSSTPTPTPSRAPFSAGLQEKGSVGRGIKLNLQGSLPIPGPWVTRSLARRHPLPAAVLPRHSSLTLSQTWGSYRDRWGLRGRETPAGGAGDRASWGRGGCRRWAGPACDSFSRAGFPVYLGSLLCA